MDIDIDDLVKEYNKLNGRDITWVDGAWYFRRDIDDCDAKEQWDEYIFAKDELEQFGLEFVDVQVEHDCISGDIRLIEYE